MNTNLISEEDRSKLKNDLIEHYTMYMFDTLSGGGGLFVGTAGRVLDYIKNSSLSSEQKKLILSELIHEASIEVSDLMKDTIRDAIEGDFKDNYLSKVI